MANHMVVDPPIYIPFKWDSMMKGVRLFSWFRPIRILDLLFGKKILLRRLSTLLDKGYVVFEGNLAVSKKYSKVTAKKQLPKIKETIKDFSELLESLEFIGFVKDKSIKQKAFACLDLMYQIELVLKKKAFAGEQAHSTSEDLKDELASKSKDALKQVFSN